MSLMELIITIALAGLLVWALTTFLPMPEPFRRAIYVIAVVGLVFYVFSALGILPRFHDIRLK